MGPTRQLIVVALSLLLIACAGKETKKQSDETLSEMTLYQQAQTALDQKNYIAAIEKLRTLESRFPFGPFAEQAQLDLIYSYYNNMEPEASKAAADRFIRLHPQHPSVDYAYYMKGLSSNTADFGLMERYMPIDTSNRDPGQARLSFHEFAEFIQKFPDSPYAADARQRMLALRNRLARYEIHVAHYYLKRKAYVAAINRGRYIVEHLQGTDMVEQGLAVMLEGYRLLGLKQPAAHALQVFKANFPDSHLLDDNGNFQGLGYGNYNDPSALNVISFGLVDNNTPEIKLPPNKNEYKTPSLLYVLTFGLFGTPGQTLAPAPRPTSNPESQS